MKYQYIDIHTHVNIAAFDEDRSDVLTRTEAGSVAYINVGTQRNTSKAAVELAEQCADGVYATIGLHPVHTTKSYHDTKELGDGEKVNADGEVFDTEYYRRLAESNKVVAIGECGFDYFRVDKDTKKKQESAFIAQIELANELEKPLMLHVRPSLGSQDAYEDALVAVKKYAKVRGNVHFFAGNLETAQKFWEIGYTTSFTGVITFADQYDEVVKNAPLAMLHAETDAPYVAPKPYRGERNEPLHVREVYKRIAELRREDEEMVREQLLQNAQNLFGI